jgi:hypothetical protein
MSKSDLFPTVADPTATTKTLDSLIGIAMLVADLCSGVTLILSCAPMTPLFFII